MKHTRMWLEIQRSTGIDRREVKGGDVTGTADGACPGCNTTPFLVQGSDMRRRPGTDDQYMANGRARCCGDPVGYLYAKVSTLFGLEEDERMMHGRARVY